MSQIVLKDVTKKFTTKTLGTMTAVNRFNLEIEEGECFSFLGPSGCGKTTTLRMIAGFEDLSEGEIHLCGRPVSVKSKNLYVPPEERGLGMVFQAFAVWPHMNIFENVALPLKVKKMNKTDIQKKVAEALEHTKLSGMENVYPSDLSGGQQQRIALARAIVTNPKVMLLDEPLSNLDPKLRESMRFEIKELQKKFNFTIIFVTHDQSEAMALSDRMMVMDMGNIVQIGTPTELYSKPNNRFVHSFLGQSTFINVVLENGKIYPKGDVTQEIPCALPEGNKREM
ncbi:MAG: ABC transporter ATP-binding protein, partial [Angelakisella sp.]